MPTPKLSQNGTLSCERRLLRFFLVTASSERHDDSSCESCRQGAGSMWQRRQILVLGMTYPSYSRKYTENVCTGGIFTDTFEMCRLHPVPKRYWDEDDRFRSWQFIEADVERHDADHRAESWRLGEHVDLGDVIPAGPKGWAERRRFLEKSSYLFDEWGALQRAHESRDISLGIVRPTEILSVKLVRKREEERAEWLAKEKKVLAQQDMLRRMKPLDFVPVRFRVEFRCKDDVNSHKMNLQQWGVHELYRRKIRNISAEVLEPKIVAKMKQELDTATRDVFLFVGTFRTRPQTQWGLMDSASPPRNDQLTLL